MGWGRGLGKGVGLEEWRRGKKKPQKFGGLGEKVRGEMGLKGVGEGLKDRRRGLRNGEGPKEWGRSKTSQNFNPKTPKIWGFFLGIFRRELFGVEAGLRSGWGRGLWGGGGA